MKQFLGRILWAAALVTLFGTGLIDVRASAAFTVQLSASTNHGSFVVGYAFDVTVPIRLTHLGKHHIDGTSESAQVGIWNSGGTLLSSASVPQGAGVTLENGVSYVPITPVNLPVGRYVIGAQTFATAGTEGFVFGATLSSAAGVRWVEGRYNLTSAFSLPTSVRADSGSYFGPNFKFELVVSEIALSLRSAVGTNRSDFMAGFAFDVTTPIRVTHLGKHHFNGTSEAAMVGLWDQAGALLASNSVPQGAEVTLEDGISFVAVTPVTLSPGRYVIGAQTFSAATAEPIAREASVAAAPGIQWVEGRFNIGNSFMRPLVPRNDTGSYLGPNFKFEYDVSQSPFTVLQPTPRAIVQRGAQNTAALRLSGVYQGAPTRFEARALPRTGFAGTATDWTVFDNAPVAGRFAGSLTVTAGWYRIEVRALQGGTELGQGAVEPVGVGDIFVTVGQSNAANDGTPAQTPQDDRVSALAVAGSSRWQRANDPQPVATGIGGSPWPQLGDLCVARCGVPVGFYSVALGSTTVADWLPGGMWYHRLGGGLRYFGPNGCKAVLWHQGESDSIDGTSAATYSSRLRAIIAQSRLDAGWSVPWGIARVSYHPQAPPENWPAIIEGQNDAITQSADAFPGPTTDDFGGLGYLADGVHFNQAGLEVHALRWASAIAAAFPDSNSIRQASIVNADFEAFGQADGAVNTSGVYGWTTVNAGAVGAGGSASVFWSINPGLSLYSSLFIIDPNASGILPNMTGANIASVSDGPADSYFSQQLSATLQPNTHYTLSAAVGVRNIGTFGGYRLLLLAGGTTLSGIQSANAPGAAGGFYIVSTAYDSGPAPSGLGQPLVIRLGKTSNADDAYVDFDSVKLRVERTAADDVRIRRQGNSFVIEWSGGGTLLESEDLRATWKEVAGATSPHTRPIGTLPTRFFQVRP
ncbi:MAG TPA: sialate O-acetylesterase [Verrucomicrobiae bacterium]|nr:sialate O-acetylesterase [Verrucomicrobiae bacterium]